MQNTHKSGESTEKAGYVEELPWTELYLTYVITEEPKNLINISQVLYKY